MEKKDQPLFTKPKECTKPDTYQICNREVMEAFGGKVKKFVDGEIHPAYAMCKFYEGYIEDKEVLELRKKLNKLKP